MQTESAPPDTPKMTLSSYSKSLFSFTKFNTFFIISIWYFMVDFLSNSFHHSCLTYTFSHIPVQITVMSSSGIPLHFANAWLKIFTAICFGFAVWISIIILPIASSLSGQSSACLLYTSWTVHSWLPAKIDSAFWTSDTSWFFEIIPHLRIHPQAHCQNVYPPRLKTMWPDP